MCVGNILYNVNKYDWPLSPNDVTLKLDSARLSVSRASLYIIYGDWSVATNPFFLSSTNYDRVVTN